MKTSRLFVLLRALTVAAFSFPASSPAQQTPLQDFRQIPYFWTQSPQTFQRLWQSARAQTLRIAIIGDSQETSPTSEGYQYFARLNFEMWQRFGNVPETPLEGCATYGAGSPPADWLMRGSCFNPGPVATRLATDQILPNVSPAAFSTLNSQINLTQGSHGQLTMLQQDAIDVDAGAAIPTTTSYFNTTGTVKARIFAATNPSSGEIAYRALPTSSHVPSYSATATTTDTLTLGLESNVPDIKAGNTQALDFNGNRYMALEVFGSDDRKLTDIVGLRFFNETHPEGVIFDTFSRGGYTATKFVDTSANAGAMFRAFGFQAGVVHLGASEAGGVTAEQFKTNIEAVISRVRSWTGNPSFPFMLIADVYQQGLSDAEAAQFDKYVGAELAIAQTDPNVMIINARRLMEDIGWNGTSGDSGQFLLADGKHYSAHGAIVLAAAEAAAMMGEVRVTECVSDPNSVTLDANTTLSFEISGTTACTDYGQYANAQTLTLEQPSIHVSFVNSFVPALGQQFKVLSAAAVSGAFKTLDLPTLPSHLKWDSSALYTDGTLRIIPSVSPTIELTSGVNQSVALPSLLAPLAFTVSGAGTLTVAAQSSNPTLLPSSAITISSGCGSTASSCSATLVATPGQTGSTTVQLSVADAYGQTSTVATTAQINAAADPGSSDSGGGGNSSGGSSSGGSGAGSGGAGSDPGGTPEASGGGGLMDLLSLLTLASVALYGRRRWVKEAKVCRNGLSIINTRSAE
jgi:hypothetical protein